MVWFRLFRLRTIVFLRTRRYTERHCDDRLEDLKKGGGSSKKSWCNVATVISRRLLFRLIPICQCGGALCVDFDLSQILSGNMDLVELDHFRCLKVLGVHACVLSLGM